MLGGHFASHKKCVFSHVLFVVQSKTPLPLRNGRFAFLNVLVWPSNTSVFGVRLLVALGCCSSDCMMILELYSCRYWL